MKNNYNGETQNAANTASKNNGTVQKVLNDIKAAAARYDLIKKDDHIVVGLSGGPDSVCLFFALYILKDELGITLSAVHINHKFRPGAAEADQEYVEKLCEKLGIRQTSIVRDCNEIAKKYGITSEEAGRRVRYEAFDEEADYVAANSGKRKEQIKIAVAHNAEDQAETLLFRIIRGTGTDGLAGIERKRPSDKGYNIIRPILGINRSDIEAFCEEKKLNPRIDHTNLEPIYTRNKIRLELIPYITGNLNENITETLNRLATIAGEDKEYFRQKTDEAYEEALAKRTSNPPEIEMSLEVLKKYHKAIRSRVVLKALSELGLSRDIGAQHIEAVNNIISRGVTGKTAELPYGYSIVTRYDKVAFKTPIADMYGIEENSCKNLEKGEEYGMDTSKDKSVTGKECLKGDAQESGSVSLSTSIITLHDWNTYSITHRNGRKNFAAFDYEALCKAKGQEAVAADAAEPEHTLQIATRARRSGDYIKLVSGTKKLQDFFVDSKIPRDMRDSITVIAAGNEVLWIPGKDNLEGLTENNGTVLEGTVKSEHEQDDCNSDIQGKVFHNILITKGRYSSNYSVSNTTKTVILLELTQKL